ncbi:MAG TPA: anti-sigma factor [Chloroflexia bacterium]|nr:anti-sigma factor [Chloroflexia bacterium]
MDTTIDPFREQLAAYALDASDPEDAVALEAHLATCAGCRAELERFQLALTALAIDAAPVAEPAGHRDRFLSKVAALDAAPAPAGHRERLMQKLDATAPASAPARRWWALGNPFAGWATAGALALGLVVALVWGADGQQRAADATTRAAAAQATVVRLTAQQAQVLPVLSSSQARSVTLAGTGALADAQVQLWLDASSRQAFLVATDLPAAPAGKVYELWMIRGETPVAVEVFTTEADGTAVLTFALPPGALSDYGVAAVTIEERKVDQPTSQPILVGKVV